MDKKEEVRQWIDDLIFKLQQKDFTGSFTVEFYQGGVTGLDVDQRFKNLEKVSLVN